MLCSPATLFAVLAVVRHSVEQFRLERTSDDILRCLGSVTAEWTKYSATVDKVVRHTETLHRSVNDELAGTRRRVFEQKLAEIDRLRDGRTIDGTDLGGAPATGGEALVARMAGGDVRPLSRSSDDRPEAV